MFYQYLFQLNPHSTYHMMCPSIIKSLCGMRAIHDKSNGVFLPGKLIY